VWFGEIGQPVVREPVARYLAFHPGAVVRVLQRCHGSLRAAVFGPEGQANGDHGPRIRVGVTIESHVQALVAGVIDQPQVVQMATDALGALQQLPSPDEGGQQKIAQRPILEQQRPQRLALNRDVAQRLCDYRRHENRLAGQQAELSEESRRAVPGYLVARLVADRHLSLDDRDERVLLIADSIQHVADIRRALVAELGDGRQLRRGQPGTWGTWHDTKRSKRGTQRARIWP